MSIAERPLDYFLLNGATPSGPAIGKLGEKAIAEFVTDCFGKRYRYVGLAPRTWGGDLDVDALKSGEFILPPCLLYRLDLPSPNVGGFMRWLLSSVSTRRRALHSQPQRPCQPGSRRESP